MSRLVSRLASRLGGAALAVVLTTTTTVVTAVLSLGAWSAMTPAASAATGDAEASVTYSCTVVLAGTTFPAYDWNPTVTVSAIRPAGSATVTATAHTTVMAGASPAPLNYDVTNSLKLGVGGSEVTLAGAGHVSTTGPYATFALPDTTGTFTSSAADVAVVAKSFVFTFPKADMTGTCTPTAGTALGTMTIATGNPPTPTPAPTTTSSATATPSSSASASASAAASGDAAGTPARGKVTFSCVLNPLSTKFDYPATITVAGYRADPSDDVSLTATMTNLPGIAPVAIDGTMNVTLGLTVGGTKTSLTGTTHAKADPKQTVAVPTLSGTVAADGDELKVLVSSFSFDFPDMSIDADCTASSVSIGTMSVGSESTDSGTTTTAAASTLPKTGAGGIGTVLLWALALILLGSGVLIALPRAGRRTR